MTRFALLVWMTGCAAKIDQAQIDAVLALDGDPDAGSAVYDDNCEECHDADGMGKGVDLPSVVAEDTDDQIVESILSGPSIMPNFVNKLEDQQVADVLAYLHQEFGPPAE